LLFRAGSFEIELQFEAKSTHHVALTGQITSPAAAGVGHFHVVAQARDGRSLHTASSENGEFYLEVQNFRDLELMLFGSARPIVISLVDPFADLPGRRTLWSSLERRFALRRGVA